MSYPDPHRFYTQSGTHGQAQPHPQPSPQMSSHQYPLHYPSDPHGTAQKTQVPMRRTSSYRTGDDMTFFDDSTDGSNGPGGGYSGNAGHTTHSTHVNNLGSRHSQFSVGSSQYSAVSQVSSHGSSALSGYHHQHQPPPSSAVQQPYNPQHFVQPSPPTQAQSGYNAPYTPSSPYAGQSFQTYNPAAYQSSTPTTSYQATANAPWHSGTPVQSYASSPQFSYQDPQSSVPNRPYEGYNDYPYDDSARPSLGYTPNTPQHTVNSPLLTQSPAHPNLPPPPPPPQGNSPGSYGTDVANEHHGRNSYSNRYTNISQTQYPYPSSPPPHGTGVQQLSPQHYNSGETYFTGIPTATSQSPHENIAPPPPLHQTSSMPPRRADTLTRHPQSRPLPGPPSGSNNIPTPSHDGDGYDEILKEIEAAVMEGRPVSTRRHSSRTSRARPTQPPIPESDDNSVSGMQTQTNGGSRDNTNTDDCSDDSDTVAAAGLAALKMAEEEEAAIIARRNTHTSTSSSYGYQPPESTPSHSAPPQTESNSDSDFVIQDVGFYGGYNAPMHYGTDQTIPHAHDRVAATSGSIRSSNRSTDDRATTADEFDYPGFDHDSIHPFPQFTPTARVDNVGTGGLSEPSFQERRRLSFDNGDETIRSRQSQSSSIAETPEEDGELPDLFFHPGMSSRPLPPPPIPSGAQNLIPGLMPAGTYRSNEQSDGGYEQYYQLSNPASPDGFQPHPNSSAVPRSTSLSDHTTTHRADPIIRSKTDAERTKTKQSNYESAISTPSVTLDLPVLPAGKRKKFNPAKLSTEQFKKCKEPWGLSSIVSWVKDLAEEEADLKEQSIVNAIVALFTHKVPTMNTADAETLGAIVVQNMFSAGVLIEDEEWVKFGTGSLSGVLWQITGQGCYSSRLHVGEFDGFGRCYSHHCMRTLKKINLQTQVMEPQKKAEDWATFYKIGKEVFDTHSRKEIDRQNNLHEIVTTEDSFIGQLDVLRSLYRDQLHSMQPSVISPKKLDRFLRDVFGKVDEVKKVNEEFLLAQLKYCQREQGPFILGFSHIFREWIRKAKAAYIDYAATFPYANYLVRREAQTNILFRQFLKQARENKLSNRLSWDTYLKAPITRIQRYTLLLSTVHKNMEKDSEEKLNLQHAIEEIKLVALECDNKVGEMTKKVDLKELGSKLQLRPEMKRVVELNLEHLGREIIHQGDLQRPRTKRFNWVDVRAILFDHYLVLSKIVPTRDTTKPETYDVSKLPIPMDLLVLVSTNDDPVIKSTVKGISSIAPVNTRPAAPGTLSHVGTNNSTSTTGSAMSGKTITTTVLESSRDDKVLYPFRIKHLGEDTYFLYASTAQCRQEWCEKIIEAKTKHAASLYAQNAEPFRLRVLSDSAFAYPDQAVMPKCAVIRGTPLDRAIREVEKKYEGNLSRPLPICRASVNCATVFSQPQGRMMCAVGTDYGVFISAYDDPRGWSKTINMLRVTQISVFEEFNLFLLIADKSLIAYHLDSVCPVNGVAPSDSQRRAPQKLSGNREVGFFAAGRMKERALVFYKKRDGISSTFKVLEPVLQRASSSRARFLPRRGQTEFFREYDEFYIPADSYSINIFHTSLAISTSRGVEVLTLDKKQPWSVPNLRSEQAEVQSHLNIIANRIKEMRPLGMFRLSETEFLVAFQECAVYVNKHGDVSRSVIMKFVGHAQSACLCGKFLLLFNEDFVEVRNAMNGRLRQVISGRNVTLLDDGGNGGSSAAADNSTPAGMNFNEAASGRNGLGISSGFATTGRTVKICMQHPEYERSQVVLEVVENEGQED